MDARAAGAAGAGISGGGDRAEGRVGAFARAATCSGRSAEA